MQCPICRSNQTGKVGADQYYCWSCCVEFNTDGVGEVYEISEDGSLVAISALEG
jgi:hypothetical protein